MRSLIGVVGISSLLAWPGACLAQGAAVVGLGATDALTGERPAAEVRLEYRPAWSLLPPIEPVASLRPWAGIEATTRGAFWGGAGLLVDIPFGRFALTPTAGVGGYAQGHGKDLGSPLEFRTGVELAYVFVDASRLALAFSHMSNAGVARHNPGTEALLITYQIPLSKLLP